jgi:hypothetical protein
MLLRYRALIQLLETMERAAIVSMPIAGTSCLSRNALKGSIGNTGRKINIQDQKKKNIVLWNRRFVGDISFKSDSVCISRTQVPSLIALAVFPT